MPTEKQKAYHVGEGSEGEHVITFASSSAQARREGGNELNLAFEEVSFAGARRGQMNSPGNLSFQQRRITTKAGGCTATTAKPRFMRTPRTTKVIRSRSSTPAGTPTAIRTAKTCGTS